MRPSVLMLACLLTAGCGPSLDTESQRGAMALEHYGCGSCHTVRGINGANGLVGPPLTGIGSRTYVAGILENNSTNLAAWIRDPRAINPKTAMPKVGVSQQDANDIAAYLSRVQRGDKQ